MGIHSCPNVNALSSTSAGIVRTPRLCVLPSPQLNEQTQYLRTLFYLYICSQPVPITNHRMMRCYGLRNQGTASCNRVVYWITRQLEANQSILRYMFMFVYMYMT